MGDKGTSWSPESKVLGRSACSVTLQVDHGRGRANGFVGVGGTMEFLVRNTLVTLNDGEEVRVSSGASGK